MVDLAMHMMDIVQNSIRANATRIEIDFLEDSRKATLAFSVKDNGSGMAPETVEKLEDPFFTTRTTRRVGLGVPFLKMSSEQTGGSLKIQSELGVGTTIEAVYKTNNPDCLPLGDLAGYMVLLLVANPEIHFSFRYRIDGSEFLLDTQELAQQGITELSNNEMASALKEYINENLKEIYANRKTASYLC
ncbi:MAG: ATP-binding protein [Bacteroidia bacterium]|nr:ATP-binding protein [Bacteroidia bacterium]